MPLRLLAAAVVCAGGAGECGRASALGPPPSARVRPAPGEKNHAVFVGRGLPWRPRNRTPLELQGPYGGPLPGYRISREDLRLDDGRPDTAHRAMILARTGGAPSRCCGSTTRCSACASSNRGGKLLIAPQDGGLPYVAGHTITTKGLVWVNWEPDRRRLEVRLPSTEVLLPEQCDGKNVSCEGCGPAAQTAPGTCRVGPGQFVITAR